MDTREEINRRTRLPINEKKVEFVRIQRTKATRGHYSRKFPVPGGRNTHVSLSKLYLFLKYLIKIIVRKRILNLFFFGFSLTRESFCLKLFTLYLIN